MRLRTARCPPKSACNGKRMDRVEWLALAREREDEVVAFARRLIATPSMPGEEGAVAALVQEEMRRLGYDEVRADELGNVIGVIRGRGSGRSVMLNTHLARTIRAECAVVGEPSANTLRRGHRGRVGILAEAHGRAAHASVGHRAINPHYALAAFLCRLRDVPMREQEPFGASSVAPTLYRTDSTSSNVIPSTAQVYLDWRNVPAESPDDALAVLRPLLEEALPPGATGDVRVDVHDLTTYTGIRGIFPYIRPSFLLEEDNPLLLVLNQAAFFDV